MREPPLLDQTLEHIKTPESTQNPLKTRYIYLLINLFILLYLKKFPSLSTPISSKKSAENALKLSLESRAKAALTGHPQPKDKIVAHVKKGNSVTTVVKNPDGHIYSFDRNKGSVGGGIQGEVYNAVNHSSPKTPTVVKETVHGYRPANQRPGETAADFKNRAPAEKTKDLKEGYGILTDWTNKEHTMLKKVGLDAGKPTIAATPNHNVAYLPMKKAEGNSYRPN